MGIFLLGGAVVSVIAGRSDQLDLADVAVLQSL